MTNWAYCAIRQAVQLAESVNDHGIEETPAENRRWILIWLIDAARLCAENGGQTPRDIDAAIKTLSALGVSVQTTQPYRGSRTGRYARREVKEPPTYTLEDYLAGRRSARVAAAGS